MILTDTYEPKEVLDDVFFPIVDSIEDKKLGFGVALVGRLDEDPDIDAELTWALVQDMKDKMTERAHFPNDGKIRQRIEWNGRNWHIESTGRDTESPLNVKDVTPMPGRAKEAPMAYVPHYEPAKPISRGVVKDDHYYMLKARKRIQEIEDFDRRTWGIAYGALDLWLILKEFAINVGELVGSIGTLAKRRIVGYWSNKLIHWGEEINNVREENRKSRRR